MTEWKPAWQMHGLHTVPLMAGPGSKLGGSGDEVSAEIVRTMTDARAWASFISIFVNTCGVLSVVLSVAAFIFGVRRGDISVTASGLFGLLWSSIVVTAGVLLAKYNGNVSRFIAVSTSQHLDGALRSLRSLWIFTAIVLLIYLVNMIGVAIWIFSAGIVSLN
jgi:hypothetical protein